LENLPLFLLSKIMGIDEKWRYAEVSLYKIFKN
jgi:hypothetical protein